MGEENFPPITPQIKICRITERLFDIMCLLISIIHDRNSYGSPFLYSVVSCPSMFFFDFYQLILVLVYVKPRYFFYFTLYHYSIRRNDQCSKPSRSHYYQIHGLVTMAHLLMIYVQHRTISIHYYP